MVGIMFRRINIGGLILEPRDVVIAGGYVRISREVRGKWDDRRLGSSVIDF